MVDGARIVALAGALALAGAGAARAQESDAGRRTLRLDPAAVPGPATLADAAWLVGAWRGEGLGGAVQEVWGEPVAGRMVGTFTSLAEGGVRFHEIMALVETAGSLELWVKHFDADFTAWEEGADRARFALVRAAPDTLYFHGLTLVRLGEDRMRAFLAMRRDGELHEETLEYRRAGDAGREPRPRP